MRCGVLEEGDSWSSRLRVSHSLPAGGAKIGAACGSHTSLPPLAGWSGGLLGLRSTSAVHRVKVVELVGLVVRLLLVAVASKLEQMKIDDCLKIHTLE